MQLTARPAHRDEADLFLSLMCRSFNMDVESSRRIFYADPFYDLALKRVLVDDSGVIVSCLTLIPGAISLGSGVSLPICGVAGVCTEPQLRGRGYAATLISETMAQLAESDYVAAALTAARPDYYEKLGWAVCGDAVQLTLAAAAIAADTARDSAVRTLTLAEMPQFSPQIRAVYHSLRTSASPGAFERDDRRWRCIEQTTLPRRIAAYFREGKITGYASYLFAPSGLMDGAKSVVIQEVVAVDPAQESALINYLAGWPSYAEVSGMFSPSQARRLLAGSFAGAAASAGTSVLLRAVNVARLAARLCDAADKHLLETGREPEFVIETCAGEHGAAELVKLNISNGQAQVTPFEPSTCVAEIPRLIGKGGAVTQLLLGYRSLAELLECGEVVLNGVREDTEQIILGGCAVLFPKREIFLSPLDMF